MTVSIDSALAVFAGTAVIIALATLAVLFFAYRARVRGFIAQARSARYVVTYEDALQWLGVRYRERDRLVGVAAAMGAVAAQVVATMLMQLTFLATVEKLAATGETVSVHVPLGLVLDAKLGDDGWVQAGATTYSAAGVFLPVVVFILFSRPWRLLTVRRARRASEI
jgi:cbb3-type cytochrome oxidase subunit 3